MSRFFLVRAEGNNADTTYPSDDVKETIGTFAFSPYFRYTLFHFGNVSLFGDAKFSYMIINDHFSLLNLSNAISFGCYNNF